MGLLQVAQQIGGILGYPQGQQSAAPQQDGISVQDGSGQSVQSAQLPFPSSAVHPSVWDMLKNAKAYQGVQVPSQAQPQALSQPDMGMGAGVGVPSHFTPLSAMKFGLGGFR